MCREYDMKCIDEIDGKFFVKEVFLVPRWEEVVNGPFDTIQDVKEFLHNED